MEIAPDDRAHPQRPEKTIGDPAHMHRVAARSRLQNHVVAAVSLQRAESCIPFLPIQIIRIRKIAQRKNLNRLKHAHQPGRIVIRQRLQQRPIHKRENRNGRRHPQRQNQNRRAGEPHILPQLPQRETEILQRRLPPEPKHIARFLAQFQIIPKFPPRRVPRLLLPHPAVAHFPFLLPAVKFHLLLQFPMKSLAAPKNSQLPQDPSNRRHRHLHQSLRTTLARRSRRRTRNDLHLYRPASAGQPLQLPLRFASVHVVIAREARRRLPHRRGISLRSQLLAHPPSAITNPAP